MARILIPMDDINYMGGGHFATFKLANHLCKMHDVSIYSPSKAEKAAKERLCPGVALLGQKDFSGYDYIVVPFENSMFREEVAQLTEVVKIQWVHIDYAVWSKMISIDFDREKKLYAAFDKIVFVSEHNKESFLTIFPQFKNRCEVVYNFLDTESVQAQSNEFIDPEIMKKGRPDELNIVVSGRLEPQKAYHRLIDVAKILKDQGLMINWFILGTGYEYEELRSRCLRYGLESVHFLGFRENPYPFVKKADIFAILSEYEGLALVVAESLAVGTPVLSTRSGGICEVLNEEYGWIIDNDIFSIINFLKKIYRERELIEYKKRALFSYKYDNNRIEHQIEHIFCNNTKPGEKSGYEEQCESHIEKENTLVSIIVPVYNTQQYLRECLDSLVSQTLECLEVVIVNDGSPDNSQQIIDEYIYRYPSKIRAFTIENRGLGEARNYGISKARGKYLGFVDSDDFVRKDMFEMMYTAAIKNNADCILSDYIGAWEDGKQEYVTSVPGEYPDRFDILRYSAKYGVVNACTKLIDRDLFEKVKFPKGFYEDLATMPILLSYAKKIYYLREGLYYYRQRSGSITSVKNNDKRLMDCYKAWDRILEQSNPVFKAEIIFAVHWSVNFFCTNFLPDFTMYSKMYFQKRRDLFIDNHYVAEAVKKKEFLNFDTMQEIPHIIHYCWFGGNEKSATILACIKSWKEFAPDFQIMEWNEFNCDLQENLYVESAYQEKQYAFVSDYFRLKALYEFGGVYLDTDMELMKPLTPHLYNSAFFAFETPVFVHAGIIGAVPRCSIIHEILHSYDSDEFTVDREMGMVTPIPRRITGVLEGDPLFIKNGKTQVISNNVKIYSANIMTLNFHDGNCVANHHYEGSWMKTQSSKNFGYEVMKHYFTWDILQRERACTPPAPVAGSNVILSPDLIFQRDYFKSECERLENSTCWRITRPLRIVADFIKRVLRRLA